MGFPEIRGTVWGYIIRILVVGDASFWETATCLIQLAGNGILSLFSGVHLGDEGGMQG